MKKVGLIGYGYWGKIIYQKLKSISDVQFICRSDDTYVDKLDSVDWIFVVTPDKTHYEITKTCFWGLYFEFLYLFFYIVCNYIFF